MEPINWDAEQYRQSLEKKMKMPHSLSIIIPCYNEHKNISLLLEKIEEEITNDKFELILVDNGSTDQTQEAIKNALDKYSFLKLVIVEKNQGYGYGILEGLKRANGAFLGWTHADLQTHPRDIFRGIQKIFSEKNAKNIFLKGYRRRRPFKDNIFTWGMAVLLSLLFRCQLWENQRSTNYISSKFF